jgi:hypothetical protein
MMIGIRYVCGHTATISETVNASPVCACGERRIAMVDPRRMPRFTGTVTGPVSEYQALEPGTANLAPGGPLKLKDRGN